ncbi:MAG: metalloregulator ArsR/SmtB family transcription factor [Candidatus Bathyarchaeota archaeon]|nr:metalloregulator ArsR/SmtB family transcription factor [Candidatus Bathyarchaeota archaeon]
MPYELAEEHIHVPDERTLEFKTRIFKVISDTNRLRILEMLRVGELCQCEVVPLIDQSQPTVSRHLRLLEEAGLIKSRREGIRMFYEVTDPHIYNVIDAIDPEMTRLISEELTKKMGL